MVSRVRKGHAGAGEKDSRKEAGAAKPRPSQFPGRGCSQAAACGASVK